MLRDVTNTGSLNTCVPHKQTLVLTELLPTPNKQIILLDRWTTLKVLNIIVAIMLMFISFVGLHQWGKERIKISSNCDFWLSPPTTQIYSFCSYLLNKSLLFPLSHCFVISYEISRLGICLCAHYWMGGICSLWYPLKWYLMHVVSSLRYTIYVVSSSLRHYHNH